MLKDLIKIASKLDALGLYKEADRVDILIEGLVTKRAGYASDPAPEVFMGFDRDILIQAYDDVNNPNMGIWEPDQYRSASDAFDSYLGNVRVSRLDEGEVERYNNLTPKERKILWNAVNDMANPSLDKMRVQDVERRWNIPSPEELNRKVASRGKGTSDEQFEGYREENWSKPFLSYDPRQKERDFSDSLIYAIRRKKLSDMEPEARHAYLESARKILSNMTNAKLAQIWEDHPKEMEKIFGRGTLYEVKNPNNP